MVARSLGCLDRAFQIPFYRAADSGRPYFALFAPLAENGVVRVDSVDARLAFARAAMVLRYPSQWRSIIGLGPVLLWHAIIRTPFVAQPIALDRLGRRPMQGPLLYERLGGPPFAVISEAVRQFVANCEGDV